MQNDVSSDDDRTVLSQKTDTTPPRLPDEDDDRTILSQETDKKPPSLPAKRPSLIPAGDDVLPIGTMLEEFEITGIIGRGGFGIVYDTTDHLLQRRVALKEYMPSALAIRDSNKRIIVKSEKHSEVFQIGLRSFINEARLLANFDNPALVKVHRFWEDNGTAYMAMQYCEGVTLKETLTDMGQPPDEKWLKNLLSPLLDALGVIHKDQCFHRDIAPDNILILPDGRPVLLDFGAARRVVSNMDQILTVILKPGYAPFEQYGEIATLKQGPWTDIYALAAVAYFAITGKPPIASVSRVVSDTLVPISEVAAGQYSANFLKAIDQALAVKPGDRPQNVDELRHLLELEKIQLQHQDETLIETQLLVENDDKNNKPSSNVPYIAIISIVLIAAVGVGVYMMMNEPAPVPAVSTPASVPTQAPVLSQAQAKKKAFDPITVLDEIFDERDRDHAVTISVEKAQVRIGKDRLYFEIRSAKSGYVYLLMVGTNHSDFFKLFPNSLDEDNYIKAGKQFNLPRPEWRLGAEGPPGVNNFIVIVSSHPRDFSAAGIKSFGPFAKFPFESSAQLYLSDTGVTSLFAGKTVCPEILGENCDKSYGAAVFSIEEIEP